MLLELQPIGKLSCKNKLPIFVLRDRKVRICYSGELDHVQQVNKQRYVMKMKKTVLLMMVLCGAGSVISHAASQNRPNVLFIAIDDLNDWIGCFGGNAQVKTPNLDRLNAEGGMVMYDAHAPSTVCCPSRTALLTGVYAHKTGVYGNKNNLKRAPKAKDRVTLPEYFSQHGYYSLSMGKIFHKHALSGNQPQDQGQWAFDEWHKTRGGMGPASQDRPVNGLPTLPGDTSYHAKAFDWGPTVKNDETQMMDYNYGGHRIYDGRYSYSVFEHKGSEELYDHRTDPMEWTNLAHNPEYTQIRMRLKAHLPIHREPESPRNK